MKKLHVLAAIVGVATVACQDYESPGGVADESVWSHVPADSSEGQAPEREHRQRELAELEERIANLQYRVDRVQSALEARPESPPDDVREIAELRGTLQEVNEDLRDMRALYDEPDAFQELQESVEEQLDDVDTRVQALNEPAPEPEQQAPPMDNGPQPLPAID